MIYNTKKAINFILFCGIFLFLAGCNRETNSLYEINKPLDTNKIVIAGSSTILPVSESWALAIGAKTDLIVHVEGGGSTSGINLLKRDEADIAAISRNLMDSEKAENIETIEIGKDSLAVILNKSNRVQNLTTEQLRGIFSGQIKNWKEVGGDNLPIRVINRESGSGTRTTFEELILCNHNSHKEDCPHQMTLSAIVVNSNVEVKRSIASIKGAVGYISFGFLDDTIKPIKLNNIQASVQNVKNNTYPLSRGLFYLIKKDHITDQTREFIDFVLSSEGQSLLEKEGFISVY